MPRALGHNFYITQWRVSIVNEGGLTRPQTAFEKRTGSQVNRQMFMDILLNNLVLSFERLVPLFGDM